MSAPPPPHFGVHSAPTSAPSSAPASDGGGGGLGVGGVEGGPHQGNNGAGAAAAGRANPPPAAAAAWGGGGSTAAPARTLTKAVSFGTGGGDTPADALRALGGGAAGNGGNGATAATAARKPGAGLATSTLGLRRWVRIDDGGAVTSVVADKHALTQALGVQPRDLRLLDPHLATSYPTAILCRDKALVVNLEHIKAVITASHVLVLNADDGAVGSFIEELSRRVGGGGSSQAASVSSGEHVAAAASAGLPGRGGLAASLSAPDLAAVAKGPPSSGSGSAAALPSNGGGALSGRRGGGDAPHSAATPRAPAAPSAPALGEVAPFELRALEVALEVVCAHLEALAGDLEAAAHPALDDLTAAVTTPNLERVRRIKSRLVRLTTRVETLREALEKILDDDADMHDMNLTARAADVADRERGQKAAAAAAAAVAAAAAAVVAAAAANPPPGTSPDDGGMQPFLPAGGSPVPPSPAAAAAVPGSPFFGPPLGGGSGNINALPRAVSGASGDGGPYEPGSTPGPTPGAVALAAAMRHAGLDPASSVPAALEFLEEEKEKDEGEIAEVEMVLEAYFMQVDATFNRLQTLCEYIDDTEDYINIELDNHRNQLIRLELMLTAATFCVALVGAVSGIFGMNLHNKAEDSYGAFVGTAVASSVGAVLCFLAIVAYCKKRGLF